MGAHLNLDGGTLNLDGGTRHPYNLSTGWKVLDVKLARFAVKIAAPKENNHSTAAGHGKEVL